MLMLLRRIFKRNNQSFRHAKKDIFYRTNLGHVLTHIYDYAPYAAFYFKAADHYKVSTPCIVVQLHNQENYEKLHNKCLKLGFNQSLGVAPVSDLCDRVIKDIPEAHVEAFNECITNGWLAESLKLKNNG